MANRLTGKMMVRKLGIINPVKYTNMPADKPRLTIMSMNRNDWLSHTTQVSEAATSAMPTNSCQKM